MSRGSKQGDPLLPSLFAIAEDVLSTNLARLVASNSVRPMIAKGSYKIPLRLLFVDDIVIFANGNMRGNRNILELLDTYEKASEQVVSKAKIKLFLGAMSYSRKIAITRECGFSVAQLPERYLGVKGKSYQGCCL